MQKRTGIIIVLLLLTLMIQAQQKFNYSEVDKFSYELYMNGNWKELIQYSAQARQQGIDFFFLQARTGIAYYNLKRYRAAAEWFLKAWKADKSFEWLQDYLYYSLLFGGRTYEAYKVAQNFTPSVQEKIGYTTFKLTGMGLEAGYSFNPEYEGLKTAVHGQKAGTGSGYGEAFYLKDYHFESFDLSHRVAPSININHSFTHLGINRTQHVDWGNSNDFDAHTRQFQYFINPSLVLGQKWYVAPAFSFIWGDLSYASGGIRDNNRFFGNATIQFRDFVYTLSAWTHFGVFSPGAEYNYGNINNEDFSQYSIWMTLYPLSNLTLYFTPRIYFKSSENSSFGYNTIGVSGGMQTGPVHLHLQYLNGNMENFIESAGYVISNFPGISDQKLSGSLYFPAGKKHRFVMRYIMQDMTETYRVYNNLVPGNTLNYNYTKHTVTAGISWNF